MSPGCKETAGLGDVAGDLGDEGFFVWKDLVITKFFKKFYQNLTAIKVAAIIQKMKFSDQWRILALERRTAANITEAVVHTARP